MYLWKILLFGQSCLKAVERFEEDSFCSLGNFCVEQRTIYEISKFYLSSQMIFLQIGYFLCRTKKIIFPNIKTKII